MIAHYIGSSGELSAFISCRTRMCVVLDLFDISIYFLSFFIISSITLLFLLPDILNFHEVVLLLRTSTLWSIMSLPQVMSPTTTSSQRLMSNTPRSPRASNGTLMTLTTMT